MKIKITSDSTIDIDKDLQKKYDIAVLPLIVNLGEETLFDGVDVTTEKLYDYFDKTGDLPKTGARSPEEYKTFFKKYLDEGFDVVHVGLGSEMSSSFNNAKLAASELDNVYIVDSETLSSGTALFAIYASELAKTEKYTAKEIASKVQKRTKFGQASFVIEKLNYLYKGGRCSMLSLLGANLLRLKPRIQVKEGKNIVSGRYFGNMGNCIKKYCEDTLKEFNDPDHSRIMITYSTATKEMIDAARQVLSEYGKFKEILETKAGSVISSHCGPNTLGILYINDGDKERL